MINNDQEAILKKSISNEFNKMLDIIKKRWFKHNIPADQLNKKEQLYITVGICKDLRIDVEIVNYLIKYDSINDNLIEIQKYHMEKIIYDLSKNIMDN